MWHFKAVPKILSDLGGRTTSAYCSSSYMSGLFLRHADLPLKHSPLLSPSKEFPCTQVFLSKTDFTDDFRGVWHRILISLVQWIYDTTFLKRLLCHLTINNASSVGCSEVSVSSYLCTAHGAEQAVVSVVVTVDIWTDSLFVAGSLHAKRQ